MTYTVPVPHDVEAGVIAWLYDVHGIDARADVPVEGRAAGMVRVRRTGGTPTEGDVLDRPELFVESWGTDQGDSYDRAVTLYALFKVGEGLQDLGGGLIVTDVGVTPPVTLYDDLAPHLHRHKLNVSLVCHMSTKEV